ncbi:MAG: glutaminyl-peptide cyclotransferase [Sphingomonadaceae bacterium]
MKGRTVFRSIVPFALSLALVAPLSGATMAASPAEPQAQDQAAPEPVKPQVLRAEIVATYPHDTRAFTEGLLWHDGALYESTGQVGESNIRKVDLATGKVLAEKAIPSDEFGEGLALVGQDLVSLTWKAGIIHRWKLKGFAPIRDYSGYKHEGWGLTTLNGDLVASDGTSTLHVLDPQTYISKRVISVTLNGKPLPMLNELEAVDGMILANVWMTPYIVAIDPSDGVVRKIYDLRGIVNQVLVNDRDSVLNGIAWDAKGKRLFITGKRWPSLFEIRLVPSKAVAR